MKKKYKYMILIAVGLALTWYTVQAVLDVKTKVDEAPLDYLRYEYTDKNSGV